MNLEFNWSLKIQDYFIAPFFTLNIEKVSNYQFISWFVKKKEKVLFEFLLSGIWYLLIYFRDLYKLLIAK